MVPQENPLQAGLSAPSIPMGLKIAANLLRALFILLLAAVLLRVSAPQSETILSAYETPSDLVRMILGLAIAAWLVVQLFRGPTDVNGYRTWLYLGIAGVPFALVCLFAIW
jgi:hypothetical protein